MATDATGTPTPLGIPKFNTAVDAPSGLGSNAQMDSIDTLLANRAEKPAGIVSGEVPVWNGTTWVRSSVTRIGATSLGSGTPDATKILRGDSSWVALGTFTDYTPTWTATGTAPSLGNATVVGKYTQIGKVVVYYLRVIFGSTSTFGTGTWFFSVPVTAVGILYTGSAYLQDTSTGAAYAAMSRYGDATALTVLDINTRTYISSATPFTWAQDDVVEISVVYAAV